MNRLNILSTSQAATAISLSMDQPSSSSSSFSSTIQLDATSLSDGGSSRAIDRYNPIITYSRRIEQSFSPSSTLPPSTPKLQNKSITTKPKNETKKKTRIPKPKEQKRKSISSSSQLNDSNVINSFISRKSWSCTKPGGSITPPGSTRYLLSDEAPVEKLLDIDPPLRFKPVNEADKLEAEKTEESVIAFKKQPDQVVVLRVSLHCKGCEKKMKKHVSRMQGVSSFNVDFDAQKVTVVGEISPLDVLASISKVKNAQLWTPLEEETFRP